MNHHNSQRAADSNAQILIIFDKKKFTFKFDDNEDSHWHLLKFFD